MRAGHGEQSSPGGAHRGATAHCFEAPPNGAMKLTGERRIARAAPALLYDSPAAYFWR